MAPESKFHVLAVDDNTLERKIIERLLRHSSYEVSTVDCGRKAMEFLENGDLITDSSTVAKRGQRAKVDLIITDYCMPGMTGYDLLKKIKDSSPLRDIPVVIMSSDDVPSRVARCLEEGAEDFLLKPVKLSDLGKLESYIKRDKREGHVSEESDVDVSPANSRKRKALELEEGLQERNRARFDSVAVML